jgi:hypothetical protein
MTARIDTMKGFSWKIHSFFTLSKRKGLPHLSGLRPPDRRFRAQREDPKLVGGFLMPVIASEWRAQGTQQTVSQSSYLHES